MKRIVCILLICGGAFALAQQPPAQTPNGLDRLSFMRGDWAGKQNFETRGGPAIVGHATDRIEIGIAGRYLCEMLSTIMAGRNPTDTRHFISYDQQSRKYTAWWFNDTSTHPTEFTGDLAGNKLVLLSSPTGSGPVLRASYESPSENTLTFLLEMKQGDQWAKLFLTTYTRKAVAAQR